MTHTHDANWFPCIMQAICKWGTRAIGDQRIRRIDEVFFVSLSRLRCDGSQQLLNARESSETISPSHN